MPPDHPDAPSIVPDPDNPSEFLTNQRWDKLWGDMNGYRIPGKVNDQSMPWNKKEKTEEEYKKMMEDVRKEMVVALIGGRKTWKDWQEKSQHLPIDFYDFQYLKFFHEIKLGGAIFAEKLDFSDAIFEKQVNFLDAQFKNWVSFERATFNKDANFQQAIFDKKAIFTFAIFNKQAIFCHVEFKKSGFFPDAIFRGSKINFNQMTLSADSHLIFAKAKFDNAVPDFLYLNRIPDMRFHNFNVIKPSLLLTKKQIKEKKKKPLKNIYPFLKEKDIAMLELQNYENRKWDSVNEERYRKLKELAIENNNHEYELIFYGYEMDSKLKNFYEDEKERIFNKKWWGNILPTCLYKWVSNYGQSVWRPILWLLGLWFFFPVCYHYLTNYGLSLPRFSLSWQYLCYLFNFIFDTIKPIAPVPFFIDDFKSLWHFGTKIIATVFWFLFFLGMRNKFKI